MFVVKRSHHNPLLGPIKEHPWESLATFNWCPVEEDEVIHCVYRAMAKPDLLTHPNLNISSIGHAISRDGTHFEERHQFIKPEFEWERFGCEDPRITKLNDTYYIFYTALSTYPFSPQGIKIALATTKDFKTIEMKKLVTPFNSKAMALFPEKINGKFVAMLTVHPDIPPAQIIIIEFEKEEDIWSHDLWTTCYAELSKHTIDIQLNKVDHVEVGAPPIKTKDGWLVIYAYIQNYLTPNKVFGIEALLLDLKNPRKIISRTTGPLMIPEETYEKYGQIPNVIFPSGALVWRDELQIFYGAADTTCCRAKVNLKDILKSLNPEARHTFTHRFEGNPIIVPKEDHAWEAKATFNPAAIDLGGKIHLLYRAMSHDGTSVIGYAASKDGLHIDERLTEPIYVPREDFEMKMQPGNSGVEDPRITQIGNKLYMCYTAFDGVHFPRVAISSISVKDFLNKKWNWTKPIIFTPKDVDDKDTCLFPEKIGGNYMILHRVGSHICADFIKSLNFEKEKVSRCIRLIAPRPGMWDSQKVGIASPPIKTDKGWLLLYHGVSDDTVYRLGAALLDLKDPSIVISRTTDFILEPEEQYEKEGQVPNVVFPCGAVIRDKKLFIYYGGADSVVAVATMNIDDLLNVLTNNK